MAKTMIDEINRLKNLIGAGFIEKDNRKYWKVVSISHNIYKDVVFKLQDDYGTTKELIEGSEEYYKNFERVV